MKRWSFALLLCMASWLAGISCTAQDTTPTNSTTTDPASDLQLRSPINQPPKPQPAADPKSTPGVIQYDPLSTSSDNKQALEKLEEVEAQSKAAAGAIFVTPEKVYVKAPLLEAMISLDAQSSPYQLDALSSRSISLPDVVQIAMQNNLPIKIAQSEVGAKKWLWISSLGNFLPTLSSEVSYQGIGGDYVSPAGLVIPIDAAYLNMNSGYSQYLYKGGGILHSALEAKHKYKASKYGLSGTINDVLLHATKLYWELALNDVLLQIRIKAVELSKGLVIINEDMLHEGVNTQLDLLQAKYQLSADRQRLIAQQVDRRESAVKLATALNLDSGEDLTLRDRLLGKSRLVEKSIRPGELIKIAVEERPDLKRREELRLAALEKVKVAFAPLMPAVSTTGAVVGTGARAQSISSSTSNSTPLATTGGGTAGVGAVGAGGGVPLTSSSQNQGKHWTTRSLFTIGLDVQWTLGGMGLTQAAQVKSAKYDARREQLEFYETLNKVYQSVRDSYLSSLSAENLIIETTDAVKWGEEGLRVAELRFREGVGTYIDVLNAQRDYISALTDKAKALIKFNIAQAELLHSVGRISPQTLTSKVPVR